MKSIIIIVVTGVAYWGWTKLSDSKRKKIKDAINEFLKSLKWNIAQIACIIAVFILLSSINISEYNNSISLNISRIALAGVIVIIPYVFARSTQELYK